MVIQSGGQTVVETVRWSAVESGGQEHGALVQEIGPGVCTDHC